jgi:hypothetical protein
MTSGVRLGRRALGARPTLLVRVAAFVLGAAALLPASAGATVSLGAWIQHSPDDIAGFTTLTGDEATASVTLPFTFTVEGTNFTTLVLSTNGWLEFGANTSGSADFNNTCFPVTNHTNPFLAAYWDDLNPFGTNIRYGTVGTSPSRRSSPTTGRPLLRHRGSDDCASRSSSTKART